MNDHDPLRDLEERLRAWRPAELPDALRARLRAAGPVPRRASRWPRRALAGAFALAVGLALVLTGRFAPPPEAGNGPAAAVSPGTDRSANPEPAAEPRWLLGESLTMNIYTGVPPGTVSAALRLDGDFVAQSGLFPIQSADGKLTLKVDCQF